MFLAHSLLLVCTLAPISQVLGNPSPTANPLPQYQHRDNKAKRSPVHFPLRTRGELGKRAPNGRRLLTVEELVEVRKRDLERQTYLRRRDMSIHEKRSSSETLGIGSYNQDTFYFASIQMGTPPQTIDVSIDTGSADLWVQANTCQGCQSNLTADGSKASFDFQASTSYKASSPSRSVEAAYSSGANITGLVGYDKVTIGEYTYSNQSFILAVNKTGDFAAAGTMGFGFTSIAASGTPWWLNVLDQFEAPEFSLCLAEWETSPGTMVEDGGQLTLGGRNQTLYNGDITFVPLIQQSMWVVPLESVIVNSNTTISISANSTGAAIDSGTKLIYGPDDLVSSFYAGVPGAQQGQTVDPLLQGFWLVPCSTVINPQFKFSANASFTVPSTNFLYAQVSNNAQYCVAALMGNSNLDVPTSSTSAPTSSGTAAVRRSAQATPSWTLGTAYMKSVYTVFQKGQQPSVGFAPISGVDYNTNRTQTIGVGTDGVNGRLGKAGVTGTVQPTQTSTVHSGAGRTMGVLRSCLVWVILLMAGYAVSW